MCQQQQRVVRVEVRGGPGLVSQTWGHPHLRLALIPPRLELSVETFWRCLHDWQRWDSSAAPQNDGLFFWAHASKTRGMQPTVLGVRANS